MLRALSKIVGATGYILQYGCITHCTFEYLGDFVVCSGPSMEPTLHSNNILVTERVSARLHRIKRGDVIIAKNPTNPTQHICKRVIGLPGDKIITAQSSDPSTLKELKPNELIPGIKPDIALMRQQTESKNIKISETIVPRGHVWIEGDNSSNSSDSRYYGPIPQGLIKGRALCRFWPIDQFKLLL